MASILETIQNTIKSHIKEENAVFVFSTDIACSTWAEWAVKNTDVHAVARERFKAWDHFKEESTEEMQEGHPVPGLLRKVFVENLMSENAEKPIFKKIISPEFASESSFFIDWICSVLPSLKSWVDRYEKIYNRNIQDEEDADYMLLFDRYSDFLVKDPVTGKEREEKLYEPAWETKKLFTGEKTYYIFFPEILDDYADYKEFFDSKENKNLVVFHVKDCDDFDKEIPARYFSNSRTEFRKLCLELRYLHEQKNIHWRDMAVSVPDVDTYLPYIERDLNLYCIPYVVRSGQKVTGINAGSIFRNILDVKENDYSYSSMRDLLTNTYVPWKEPVANENLIREGANRKILCKYDKNIDIWEESLKEGNKTERELTLYREIKKWIDSLTESKTFFDVRKSWFASREKLFAFSEEENDDCNLVLGHCLDQLEDLVLLEKKYNCHVKNPFKFFVDELDNSVYQKQNKKSGVSIFKYKVSSTANFEVQFVVNGSQKDLTVSNTQLKFLNNEKRKALKLNDEDSATEPFILLYAKGNSIFSSAQMTVNGYAIPHSRFTAGKPDDSILPELMAYDYPKMELNYLKGEKDSAFPEKLYESQNSSETGFSNYALKNKMADSVSDNTRTMELAKEKLEASIYENGKVKVDPTALASYFPCRRRWFMQRILGLDSDTLQTSLFDNRDVGNIFHKVLEVYFARIKENKDLFPVVKNDQLVNEDKIMAEIRGIVEGVLTGKIDSNLLIFRRTDTSSPLIREILLSEVDKITSFFIPILMRLWAPYVEGERDSGFGGFKPFLLEQKLEDNTSEDYVLKGTIDAVFSVEKTEKKIESDGSETEEKTISYSIVDYKTSYIPEDGRSCIQKEPFDEKKDFPEMTWFQMPAYVKLLEKKLKENEKIEQAAYFSLKKKTMEYVIKKNKINANGRYAERSVSRENFKDTINLFDLYCKRFAKEIKECESFDPDFKIVKEYKDCNSCDFKNICRFTYSKK